MNLRKYINIINEASKPDAELQALPDEFQQIASDVTAGKVSHDVMAQMVQFLTKLAREDQAQPEPEPNKEPGQDFNNNPNDDWSADFERRMSDTSPAPGQVRAEETKVEEALDPLEMQIKSLLKQVDPDRHEQVWAYYNKKSIEKYIIPALIEKDINKEDDHQRVVSLFIEAPGALEDKIAIAMKLDTTGQEPHTGGGIINTKKLTTQGKGSIDDLITIKKSPVVDYIKERLITMRVSPSTTSAATGDGEAFFLILGAGITKRGKGDLNVNSPVKAPKKDKLHAPSPLEINGKEVEVKAQGARLKGFGGKGTYGDGAAYYKTFNDQIYNVIGKEGSDWLTQATPPTKGAKPSLGWNNGKSPLHFGLANLTALSQALKLFAKKNGATPNTVKEIFQAAIKHIYPKMDKSMYSDLLKVIDKNCSFDVEEFRKQWFLMTYRYYMETSRDEFGQTYDGILFIHQPTFTYSYIKGPEAMDEQWDDFELNTTLYNWTDTQSVAPKITYGKEVREKKSAKKKASTGSVTQDLAPELSNTTAAKTKKAPVAMTRKLK